MTNINSNQTLEQYRSAVLDILDKKGFQLIFDTVSDLTGIMPTNLTLITAQMIDDAFEMNLLVESTAEVLYEAALIAYQDVFGLMNNSETKH